MAEMDKYIETFRQEADELLASVEMAVLAIEEDPHDSDAINRLFRAMHTIKGSGAMFGFDDVSAFTHHIETLLDKVRGGSVSVNREFIDIVLSARDYIAAMLQAASGGPVADLQTGAELIVRAQNLSAGKVAEMPTAPHPPAAAPAGEDEVIYRIRFRPCAEIFATGTDPGLLLDELRELGECEIVAQTEALPTIDEMDAERCYLAWDIVLSTKKSIDAVKDVFIFLDADSQLEIEELSRRSGVDADAPVPRLGEILLEHNTVSPESVQEVLDEQRAANKKLGTLLVDGGHATPEAVSSALAEQKMLERQKAVAVQDTIRVASEKLDQLVNIVGELVINQEQLNQLAQYSEHKQFSAPVEVMHRLIGSLRDLVLSVRMVPIGTTFSRYKRLIRDLSLELGKEIDLVTIGEETEMDKTVIDRLGDPLVHLIRNCVDHGIELPAQREAAGKRRHGTICLRAEHQGTNVVITVEDDGRGLDVEAIRAKAIANGLISADEILTEQQLFALIFAPGFSTASQVTNVSGRGVGMDVVKREIEALRGTISISSEVGAGAIIRLALPLTLAIIDGLLVDVAGNRYVIPVSLIEECLELTAARMALSAQRNLIQVRGEPVPIIRLRNVFMNHAAAPNMEETVVVRLGEHRLGIVVDRVIGDFQTVIKPLNGLYKHVEGVSGATILGDGNVALILDIASLLRIAKREEEMELAAVG